MYVLSVNKEYKGNIIFFNDVCSLEKSLDQAQYFALIIQICISILSIYFRFINISMDKFTILNVC